MHLRMICECSLAWTCCSIFEPTLGFEFFFFYSEDDKQLWMPTMHVGMARLV